MTLSSPFGLEQSHEKKNPQIKQIDFETSFYHSRCYLINGKIYITGYKELYIESFR